MEPTSEQHERFMRQAFLEAQLAYQSDEVPVGAVVVCQGQVIARAHNLTEHLKDATAHAEMQAITAAAGHLGGKYLRQCTLYVTLEPCPMCAAAMYWSQIGSLVYAAADPKHGYNTISPHLLPPTTNVTSGPMAEESAELLREFFAKKR